MHSSNWQYQGGEKLVDLTNIATCDDRKSSANKICNQSNIASHLGGELHEFWVLRKFDERSIEIEKDRRSSRMYLL